MRAEQDRAGDDQRVLIFLADLLPEVDVREDAFERLQILFILDPRLIGRLRRAFDAGLPFVPGAAVWGVVDPPLVDGGGDGGVACCGVDCGGVAGGGVDGGGVVPSVVPPASPVAGAAGSRAAGWPGRSAAARRRRSRGARISIEAGCAAAVPSRDSRRRPPSLRRGSRQSGPAGTPTRPSSAGWASRSELRRSSCTRPA